MGERGYLVLAVVIGLALTSHRAHAQFVPGDVARPVPSEDGAAEDDAPDRSKSDPSSERSEKRLPTPGRLPSHDAQHVSITFSPLSLFKPMFEAQVEVRIVPGLGIAPIFGIGSVTSEATDSSYGEHTFRAYELGGQLVAYPTRDFSGIQLGVEAMWLKVSTDTFNGQQLSATAAGVAVGPFFGYKLLLPVGFTVFAQLGVAAVALTASASDQMGNSEQAKKSAFLPLVNLNAGWSL